MAQGLSLTEVAYWTRRLIYGSIILLIGLFMVKTGLNVRRQRQLQGRRRQPKPILATAAFGQLPPLKFASIDPNRPSSYELQTVTGTLPQTPPIAKVFLMPKPVGITFFSLNKGKAFAAKLGFTGEPKELSIGQYRWTSEVVFGKDSERKAERSLILDVVSGNFKLSYDLNSDQELTKGGALPRQKEAVRQATEFLRSLNLYNDDLAKGEHRANYLKFERGQLLPTSSEAEAQFIKVSFFRRGIKGAMLGLGATPEMITPVTQPVFNQAQVQVTLSSASEPERKIVLVDYVYWPVDFQNFATYPLKTSQDAYYELTTGNGVVVSGGNQSKAIIRRVTLAYYEPSEHQDFFQPVFIFEGDRNFIAYVPAITNDWIEAGGSAVSQE